MRVSGADIAGRGEAVEAVLEHGVDVTVRAGTDEDGAGARRLQAGLAIALAEPQETETRAVALLGMGDGPRESPGRGRRSAGRSCGPTW